MHDALLYKQVNTIEIDATPWLKHDGDIEIGVYIGEGSCEPCYASSVSLEDLIDKELESFISPSTNKIAEYHTDDAKALIKSLKRAVKHAEKRVKKLS
jgi:Fe-S cluster biogenesis protein NfuA